MWGEAYKNHGLRPFLLCVQFWNEPYLQNVYLIYIFVYYTAIMCPEGSVYDPCASPCPETCGDEPSGNNCTSEGCIESCRCEDGHVWSEGRCIDRSECGCSLPDGSYLPVIIWISTIYWTINNIYKYLDCTQQKGWYANGACLFTQCNRLLCPIRYNHVKHHSTMVLYYIWPFLFQAGASYITEDCSEVCSCQEGQLDCTDYGCGDFANCGVQNGVRDCYCQNGFKGDGQVCFRG